MKRPKYLVFNGGGLKGVSFIGCLKAMHDLDLIQDVRGVAGSSAGAIVSLCVVLGMRPATMVELCRENMTSDINLSVLSMLKSYGMNNGAFLQKCVDAIFEKSNYSLEVTFRELYYETHIMLHVTGSCLNTGGVVQFNHIEHPDMSVRDAVVISCRIPILFEPVIINDSMYVDGCLADHYPIDIFPKDDQLGFFITTDTSNDAHIGSFEDFLGSLMKTVIHQCMPSFYRGYEDCSVMVHCQSTVRLHQMSCSDGELLNLFERGYCALMDFERRTLSSDRQTFSFLSPCRHRLSNMYVADPHTLPVRTRSTSLH